MQRVHIQVLREDAPHAALALAETGFFDPEPNQALNEQLPESPSEQYREIYRTARARLDKILSCCGAAVQPHLNPEIQVVESYNFV